MLCCIRLVLSRNEKKGWAWVAGESTPELRRGADRKVPDRPGVVKGARLLQKKITLTRFSLLFHSLLDQKFFEAYGNILGMKLTINYL
jgi:hypothetical protein